MKVAVILLTINIVNYIKDVNGEKYWDGFLRLKQMEHRVRREFNNLQKYDIEEDPTNEKYVVLKMTKDMNSYIESSETAITESRRDVESIGVHNASECFEPYKNEMTDYKLIVENSTSCVLPHLEYLRSLQVFRIELTEKYNSTMEQLGSAIDCFYNDLDENKCSNSTSVDRLENIGYTLMNQIQSVLNRDILLSVSRCYDEMEHELREKVNDAEAMFFFCLESLFLKN